MELGRGGGGLNDPRRNTSNILLRNVFCKARVRTTKFRAKYSNASIIIMTLFMSVIVCFKPISTKNRRRRRRRREESDRAPTPGKEIGPKGMG